MAVTTSVIIVGNLVRDPELRHTRQGKPVVGLTIASTPRSYNRETSQWEDGDAVFMKASCWDEMAENVAASLSKGSRVIAYGVLKSSKYRDREGNDRESLELQIDEIGHTMRNHVVSAEKRGKAAPVKGPAKTEPDGWVTVDDDETPF